MNLTRHSTALLTVVAMFAAGASLGFAHSGDSLPEPDCGEKITYFSDASMTDEIGFHMKEPLVKPISCGCSEWMQGSTSRWYTTEAQNYCF